MHSCLVWYPICRSTLVPMSRATWNRQWRWPRGWKRTKEVMGPKPVAVKDPENLKSKTNKGMLCRCKGVRPEVQFWWSKAKANRSRAKARDARAINSKIRNAEEGSSRASVTIVVETTQCGTAKSGRTLKRNSNPRETDCPAPFAHTDGPPGLCKWINRN